MPPVGHHYSRRSPCLPPLLKTGPSRSDKPSRSNIERTASTSVMIANGFEKMDKKRVRKQPLVIWDEAPAEPELYKMTNIEGYKRRNKEWYKRSNKEGYLRSNKKGYKLQEPHALQDFMFSLLGYPN